MDHAVPVFLFGDSGIVAAFVCGQKTTFEQGSFWNISDSRIAGSLAMGRPFTALVCESGVYSSLIS
jgi:hypothetical protein